MIDICCQNNKKTENLISFGKKAAVVLSHPMLLFAHDTNWGRTLFLAESKFESFLDCSSVKLLVLTGTKIGCICT